MSASSQYAFVMKNMTKTFPGAPKPVLNGINLQFYRGAKIGIVGPNGVGKSTLIKIMAASTPITAVRHGRVRTSPWDIWRRSRSSTPPRMCLRM